MFAPPAARRLRPHGVPTHRCDSTAVRLLGGSDVRSAEGAVLRDPGADRRGLRRRRLGRGRLHACGTRHLHAERPLVSIGSTDGEEPYLLDGVADAVVRQDGSLAVLNCGSAEIRVYDTEGRYLRTFGGRGEGPGEFMFPGRMFALGGDTMASPTSFRAA